jgi:hypothetical protein
MHFRSSYHYTLIEMHQANEKLASFKFGLIKRERQGTHSVSVIQIYTKLLVENIKEQTNWATQA